MKWTEEDLKSMMKDFYFGTKIQCTICGWGAMDPDSKNENLMRQLIIHRDQSHPDASWTEADMKDMMTEVTLTTPTTLSSSSGPKGNHQN